MGQDKRRVQNYALLVGYEPMWLRCISKVMIFAHSGVYGLNTPSWLVKLQHTCLNNRYRGYRYYSLQSRVCGFVWLEDEP